MKIYRTTYLLPNIEGSNGDFKEGAVFHSSAADASKARTGLKAADPACKPVTHTEEVLQTKEGILQYLNGLFGQAAASTAEQK